MIVSDELLMAYADHELDEQQRAAVESALAEDPALRQKLEQHRAMRSRLQAAHQSMLAEPVPERLLAVLEAQAPPERGAQLLRFTPRGPAGAARDATTVQRWRWWGALAASLVVVVLTVMLVQRPGGPAQTALVDASLHARGPLAAALNTQLASSQDPAAPVHIRLSYRDRTGVYCRAFDAKGGTMISGVACRSGADWQLQMLTAAPPGSAAPEYRQAGSTLAPAVLGLVQSQISGEPLDRAAEASAAQSGWR